MKSIVIVISGRGSNMAALVDASAAEGFPVRVAAVLSNRPDAPGLAKAAARGVPTRVIDHAGFADRESFDAALAEAIDAHSPDLVVLAGSPNKTIPSSGPLIICHCLTNDGEISLQAIKS